MPIDVAEAGVPVDGETLGSAGVAVQDLDRHLRGRVEQPGDSTPKVRQPQGFEIGRLEHERRQVERLVGHRGSSRGTSLDQGRAVGWHGYNGEDRDLTEQAGHVRPPLRADQPDVDGRRHNIPPGSLLRGACGRRRSSPVKSQA